MRFMYQLPSPGEDVDQGEPTRARNSWYSAQKHLLGPYTAEIARTQVTIAVVNQERPQDVDRVRRRAVRGAPEPDRGEVAVDEVRAPAHRTRPAGGRAPSNDVSR